MLCVLSYDKDARESKTQPGIDWFLICLLHLYVLKVNCIVCVCARACVFLSNPCSTHKNPLLFAGHIVGLTLAHDARQSGLELLFGLFHLLLMLALLSGQPADVTVGGLDHGVEVVGVAPVDLASFQPGQKDAHCFWKLAIIWPKQRDRGKKKRAKINEILHQSLEGFRNNREEDKHDAQLEETRV